MSALMKMADFDFDLPEDLIALEPPEKRTDARLLCVGSETQDRRIDDLPSLLKPGDLLVLNDTKVIPAALTGLRLAREGGGQDVPVEANLIERLAPQGGKARWLSLARPGKRLREGDLLSLGGLSARVLSRAGMETTLLFDVPDDAFEAALEAAGLPPLPPYIARRRAVTEGDRERYQTVYAEHSGSVAAPTAGLHFTDELFARLEERGVRRAAVTLHVGAGTFLPVTAEDPSEHKMHAEWGEVPPETARIIAKTRREGGRIISVGTTSLRLLESAWDGAKVAPFRGHTDIFLKPGDPFPAADCLLTNFHLPKSTLMMLVSGFAGTERIRAAYAHAVKERYRFFSYGDACLLSRQGPQG